MAVAGRRAEIDETSPTATSISSIRRALEAAGVGLIGENSGEAGLESRKTR